MERKGEQLRNKKKNLGPSDIRIVPYSELIVVQEGRP
jgi:hypothetical protein